VAVSWGLSCARRGARNHEEDWGVDIELATHPLKLARGDGRNYLTAHDKSLLPELVERRC
jgi:hypothetical protein